MQIGCIIRQFNAPKGRNEMKPRPSEQEGTRYQRRHQPKKTAGMPRFTRRLVGWSMALIGLVVVVAVVLADRDHAGFRVLAEQIQDPLRDDADNVRVGWAKLVGLAEALAADLGEVLRHCPLPYLYRVAC